MSDENQNQPDSSLDWMREQHRLAMENAKPINEEFFERIKPYVIEKPFRLEMFYIPEKDLFVIQGDENGLRSLGQTILSLANDPPGHHTHWDKFRTTYMNVKEVLTQRVKSYSEDDSAEQNSSTEE